MDRIAVKGKITQPFLNGNIIGGKPMMFNVPALIDVTEDVYFNLKNGVENGWFYIISDNYADFCKENNRFIPDVVSPVEETPVEETPVEETPVEETPVEETPVEEIPVEEKTTKKTKRK